MDDPVVRNFGSSENLLAWLKEKSDDIEKAVIPQTPTLVITKDGVPRMEVEVGIVLHMIDGTRKMLVPTDAEILLSDGILSRMKIPITLFRGERPG